LQKREVTFSDDVLASVDVVFAEAPYLGEMTTATTTPQINDLIG